jgi:hypothetical protein
MTRDDLRGIIQAAGHGTDAASVAVQNSLLKVAFYEVWNKRAWLWRRATGVPTVAVGDNTLNGLPTDMSYPIKLRLSLGGLDVGDVDPIRPEVIEDYLAHDSGTGPPAYWSWKDGTVVLYPTPDQIYTASLTYVKSVAEVGFDDDSDVIPWDEEFHPVLAWIAISYLGLRQENPQRFNMARAEADKLLLRMEQADSRERVDQTSVLHWSGWDAVKAG